MFKGIKEYVGDLHLSRVDGDEVVAVEARSKVEVLCEYTFIKTTPSQRSEAEMLFPAVYVPGKWCLFFFSFFFVFVVGTLCLSPLPPWRSNHDGCHLSSYRSVFLHRSAR